MVLLSCVNDAGSYPYCYDPYCLTIVLAIGAAPNAIAYDSKHFTTGEFFRHGIPMTLLLLAVLGLGLVALRPMLGMPILVTPS